METALLIIDMQVSLLNDEPWQKAALLGNIGILTHGARAAGAPVIFVRDTRVEPDAALIKSLDRQEDDPVILKGFCDAFLDTSLQELLQEAEVKKLVICGLQTDYCIDTSCRRAASLGYGVQLASDAHSTFDHELLPAAKIVAHHNRILRNFPAGAGYVRTTPTAEVSFAY